jgi:2-polyprenyl-6-hydroxyphenyl methylase/3-demethylubiquinone-9 3-methyltransferase
MRAVHDAGLERKIADRFRQIGDNGWFPDELASDSPQLAMVRDVLHPGPGMKILDAGCARGRFLRHLAGTGATLFGIDLTEVFLHSARANVPGAGLTAGSLSSLPFRDASFDAVYCIEALEHLPDTDAALAELARVLRPAGLLLVIDKSMLGLHPACGVPNPLWKWWRERRGLWMYPAAFGFREKWFWPRRLKAAMARHFDGVQVRFQTEGFGKASRLYRMMPFFAFEAGWFGRRKA